MPGYWDAIVSSAPDNSPTSKRELLHMKRNFHSLPDRRWFGSFGEWLNRLNTLTSSNSVSRNFHWSDTYTIYHAEVGSEFDLVVAKLMISWTHVGVVSELPVESRCVHHGSSASKL
jgi:hypothetical protein